MEETKELIQQAETLFMENKFRELTALLTDEVLKEKNDAVLCYWRAMAHNNIGESAEALRYADMGLAADPNSNLCYFAKGFASDDKGDYQLAIENYTKAIELNPGDKFAYTNRGVSYKNLKEYEKSIADQSRAIEIDPSYALAYNNRAVSWKALGDLEKALADYSKAIEVSPDYALAYFNRANLLGETGKPDKAIADYSRAVEIDPAYQAAWFNRGILYDETGEYDKAIEDYTRAIELNPADASSYNNRGVAWKNKGNYDEAIADYSKSLELNPGDAIGLNNIGNSWYHKGDFEKAISFINQAIEISKDYANAYRNRGNTYFAKGDFQEALNDYLKAKELGKGEFDFLEKDIKLAKEKIEERRRLNESNADPKDKEEKLRLESNIEKSINKIRSLAKSDVKTVVHYTKLFVGEIYVAGLDAKMQYSNAIYMNDPMEGKVLFDFLDDKSIAEAYTNGEKRTETSVYLGSFLPAEETVSGISHEDELVMWRTYGKDEHGKEAAGCSIVLSSDFFGLKRLKKEEPTPVDKTEELLNVIYLRLKNGKNVVNDPTGSIEPAIGQLKDELKELIALRDKYNPRDDFYREIENTIFRQLSPVTYLFKSSDYNFEHEVRVITYMPRSSDLIRFRSNSIPGEPKKRFFIESNNHILPFIKKIFLGPKVDNHQHWSLYLDFEIRQRELELRNIKDAPIPYQVTPSSIEILKSECKFQ